MRAISNSFTLTAVEDAVQWRIVATPKTVTKHSDGTYSSDAVTVEVHKAVGNKVEQIYKTGEALAEAAVVDVMYHLPSGGYDYLSNMSGELTVSIADVMGWTGRTMYLVDWDDETIVYDTFTLGVVSDGADGESPEVYEIVASRAYLTLSANGWVRGGISGQLWKILGDERTVVTGAEVEMVYQDSGGEEYVEDAMTTDSQGCFAWDDQVDGGWDEYGNLNSLGVRYMIDGVTVAQYNVGLSEAGLQGKTGKPLRVSTWAAGTVYYNGMGDDDPWTDVVTDGGNYYLCQQGHSATEDNRPTSGQGGNYWSGAQADFEMIATKVLLASNAFVELLQGNSILAMTKDSKVMAGMAGNTDYPLWVGADEDNRATAPFRVTPEGTMYATEAEVSGTIRAKNLYHGVTFVDPDHNDAERTVGDADIVIVSDSNNWARELPIILPNPDDVLSKIVTIYNRSSSSYVYVSAAHGTIDDGADFALGAKKVIFYAESGNWLLLESVAG